MGQPLYALLASFATAKGLPPLAVDTVWVAIKVLIVLHVILINGLWSIWWERKISAHIQTRVGPTYAGSPKGGTSTDGPRPRSTASSSCSRKT